MARPVVTANIDSGTITVGDCELSRYDAVGMISEVSHALAAIWPHEDKSWELDAHREGAEGRSRRS